MTQHQQHQTGSEQQIIVRLVGGVPFVEHSTWFKEREQAAFEGKLGRSEAKDFHSALASESRRMAEARDALREVDFRHLAPVAQLAVLKREVPDAHYLDANGRPLADFGMPRDHREPSEPHRSQGRNPVAESHQSAPVVNRAVKTETAMVIDALSRALDADPSLDAAHKARILEHMANGVSRATASQQQVPAVPAETPPKVQQEKTQAALPENIRQAIVAEGGRITASVGGGIDSGNVNYGVNVAHHIAGPLQGGVGLSANQEGSVSANVNAQAVIPAGPVVVYPMASVGVNDIGGNSSLSASAGGLIVKTGEIGGHAVGGYVGGLVNEKGDGTVLANASIAATDKLTFSAGVSYDVAKDNLRESIEALYRVKDNLTVRIGVDTDELQDTSVGAQISYDYGR